MAAAVESASLTNKPVHTDLDDVKPQLTLTDSNDADHHLASVELMCSLVSEMSVCDVCLLSDDKPVGIKAETVADPEDLDVDVARLSLEDSESRDAILGVAGKETIGCMKVEVKAEPTDEDKAESKEKVSRRVPEEQLESEDEDELVAHGVTGGIPTQCDSSYYGNYNYPTSQHWCIPQQQPYYQYGNENVNSVYTGHCGKYRKPDPNATFSPMIQNATYEQRHLSGGTVMANNFSAGTMQYPPGIGVTSSQDFAFNPQQSQHLQQQQQLSGAALDSFDDNFVNEFLNGHINGNDSLPSGDLDAFLNLKSLEEIAPPNLQQQSEMMPFEYGGKNDYLPQPVSAGPQFIPLPSPGLQLPQNPNSPYTDIYSDATLSPGSVAGYSDVLSDQAAQCSPDSGIAGGDDSASDSDSELKILIEQLYKDDALQNTLANEANMFLASENDAGKFLPDFPRLVGNENNIPLYRPNISASRPHQPSRMPTAPCSKKRKSPPCGQPQLATMQPVPTQSVPMQPATTCVSGMVQMMPVVTCYVVTPLQTVLQTPAGGSGRKQRPILPKETKTPPNGVAQNAGFIGYSAGNRPPCLPFIPEPWPVQKDTNEEDKRKSTFIYRKVAGLKQSELVESDKDGDNLLHLAIVKDEQTLVEALLNRLVREGLAPNVVNAPNNVHQTPLLLAVQTNNPANVRRLIAAGADINFQFHKMLSNNMGPKYYRVIHFVASRGLAFSETLDELLAAQNIDLHVFNSEGLSALHCAVESHGRLSSPDGKLIDARRTIYRLVCRGANIGLPDGLSGKTPLHYVVEKKNAEFLSWFLDLVRYISNSRPPSPTTTQPLPGSEVSFRHQIVNARTSSGAAALNIAATLQTEPAQRMLIIRLLLLNGAKVSRSDGPLRKELQKIPEIAELLRNASNSRQNSQ